LHGVHAGFHLVEFGLDAAEFFFDFKSVFNFGGTREKGAKAITEGAFIFEDGLEVEAGLGDIIHVHAAESDFAYRFERGHEGVEVWRGNADGGTEIICGELGGGDESVVLGGKGDGFFGSRFEGS